MTMILINRRIKMANVFGDFSEIQGVDEVVEKAAKKTVMNKKVLKKSKKVLKKLGS